MSKNKRKQFKAIKIKRNSTNPIKTLKQNCFHKILILNNYKIFQSITTDKQSHTEPLAKRII